MLVYEIATDVLEERTAAFFRNIYPEKGEENFSNALVTIYLTTRLIALEDSAIYIYKH
jgi:hypothetical protein